MGDYGYCMLNALLFLEDSMSTCFSTVGVSQGRGVRPVPFAHGKVNVPYVSCTVNYVEVAV